MGEMLQGVEKSSSIYMLNFVCQKVMDRSSVGTRGRGRVATGGGEKFDKKY